MRFIIPLTILLTSSLAAADTFSDILGELYGDCGGDCAITEFQESSANCGDPSSESSNSCYCENWVNIFSNIDALRFGRCLSGCDLDVSSIDTTAVGQQLGNLCGSNLGAGTTSTGSGSDSGPEETATPSASSPEPTGAASTIGVSRVALAVGALAFVGYNI